MKQTLIIVASIVFLVIACKKKSPQISCYLCTSVDSIISNKPLYQRDTTYYAPYDTICNWNQGLADFYSASHTSKDTTRPILGDTLVVHYKTVRCVIY